MALKFAIYLYFCRLGRIILRRMKKIKKNSEKSNIIIFGSGFGYLWEGGPFSETPKNFLSIFLAAWSDNFKSVKKIMKNIEKSKIILFGTGFGYRLEVGPFSERP